MREILIIVNMHSSIYPMLLEQSIYKYNVCRHIKIYTKCI